MLTSNIISRGLAAAALSGAVVAGGFVAPAGDARAKAIELQAANTVADFSAVVEAVSPAVVSVRVEGREPPRNARRGGQGRGAMPPGMENLPEDHPFRRFFDRRGERQFGRRDRRRDRRSQRRRGMGQGSGFFVSADGYVVTNNHVVRGGKTFTVVMNDSTELDAKLVGTDARTDLAVLKVDAPDRDFTFAQFDEGLAKVGQWVVAVGNPFGLGGTVTAGIVSASGRDIGAGPYDDFLQIDAAVNRGNSGGPAFNLSGEVIGVNTAIFSPSGGNVGIAFAISAKTSSKVVQELIENGTVTRGWLGVSIEPVTPDIAEAVGIEEATGAIVSAPQDGSPAAAAGLKPGDVILSVDETDVASPKELARIIASYAPETKVALTVVRDGEEEEVTVTLGKLPEPQRRAEAPAVEQPDDVKPTTFEDLGLGLTDSDDGVVIAEIEPGSAADEKRLNTGDVVVSVNGRSTKEVREVGAAIAEAMEDDRKAVLFQVRSGERSRFVALPVDKS